MDAKQTPSVSATLIAVVLNIVAYFVIGTFIALIPAIFSLWLRSDSMLFLVVGVPAGACVIWILIRRLNHRDDPHYGNRHPGAP